VFENKVMRGTNEPKRYGLTGRWKKLLNGEFNYLHSSSKIIRMAKRRKAKSVRNEVPTKAMINANTTEGQPQGERSL
jgi:hypothetical protein